MCEKAIVEDVSSDISGHGILSLAEDGPQRFGCQELHVNVDLNLHWNCKLDSIHFRLRSKFQSTNGCGLSQSRLNLDWWVLTHVD